MRNYKHIDEELESTLKRELNNNPLLMGDLLKFIGDYTEEYNAALQKQRDTEAKSAVYDLLCCYHIPKGGIPAYRLPYFIDAIEALYPDGYNYPHSKASRKFLDEFIKAAKLANWSPEDTFIKDIRKFDKTLKLLYAQYEGRIEIKETLEEVGNEIHQHTRLQKQ